MRLVAVGEGLASHGERGQSRVESWKDAGGHKQCCFARGKRAAKLVRRKIVADDKTLATTVALEEKFAGHNADAIGIAMAREKFVP